MKRSHSSNNEIQLWPIFNQFLTWWKFKQNKYRVTNLRAFNTLQRCNFERTQIKNHFCSHHETFAAEFYTVNCAILSHSYCWQFIFDSHFKMLCLQQSFLLRSKVNNILNNNRVNFMNLEEKKSVQWIEKIYMIFCWFYLWTGTFLNNDELCIILTHSLDSDLCFMSASVLQIVISGGQQAAHKHTHRVRCICRRWENGNQLR